MDRVVEEMPQQRPKKQDNGGLDHFCRIGNDVVRGHARDGIQCLANDDSRMTSAAAVERLRSILTPPPQRPAEPACLISLMRSVRHHDLPHRRSLSVILLSRRREGEMSGDGSGAGNGLRTVVLVPGLVPEVAPVKAELMIRRLCAELKSWASSAVLR